MPVYLAGVAVGIPLLILVLPTLTVAASLLPAGRRVWIQPTGRLDPRAAWALGAVSLYGLAWLAGYVYPLRPLELPPYRTPSVDVTFHQALVSALMHHVPPQAPFLLGTGLDYHWFVHAQLRPPGGPRRSRRRSCCASCCRAP